MKCEFCDKDSILTHARKVSGKIKTWHVCEEHKSYHPSRALTKKEQDAAQ